MDSLEKRMQQANTMLASYAVQHAPDTHRDPDPIRFPFQRDRDRIVSTEAYRRLTGKMQVLPPGFSDHVRNRRTHTDDVAFNARNDARALGLNEDLVECIALLHDLGHPPFGHAGEDALNECMKDQGFNHNDQSIRIVTVLESHEVGVPGIGLSPEVLEGDQKHGDKQIHLEGQLVDVNDQKTYTAHDTEDALTAKIITLDDVRTVALGARAIEQARGRKTGIRGALLDILTSDLLSATEKRIADLNIQSLQNVYDTVERIVDFSDEMKGALTELREFLMQKFYLNPSVLEKTNAGKKIVTELFDRYMQEPHPKILDLQGRTGSTLDVAVKDHIAGMTDDFARKAHASSL